MEHDFLGVSGGYFDLGNNWWNQRISSLRTPAKDKGVRLYEYGGKKETLSIFRQI
jgi:hypothetical protein